MARLHLTRPRSLGISLAVVSLALAACAKSSSNPPTPNPSPSVSPVPSGIPTSFFAACSGTSGVAYEPDGGNGGAFTGIQVTHFEDSSRALCAASPALNATPMPVTFMSSVGGFAVANDFSDAVALLRNGQGGYTLAQDVFGASVASLVPVGAPYDLSAEPPPQPSASPTTAPLLQDAQSVAILGGSQSAVALTTGVGAVNAPNAIVALTSLTNAPPQYGSDVPFSGTSYTLKTIPPGPRSIVRIGTSIDATGNIFITALARGTSDLLAFNVTTVGTGYQFDAQADDANLGSGNALRGRGEIAFDPADAGRALIGGTSANVASQLTLVTGLPSRIVEASSLALPGTIRSVAVTANGQYGIVGTNVGIFVVKGVDTGTLSLVTPFAVSPAATSASAPTYRTCAGTTAVLSDVESVAFSADGYLVALGTSPGVACPSGYNASIVAVPFNQTTGATPSPAPTSSSSPPPSSFVQNNVIAPPSGADYLVVR